MKFSIRENTRRQDISGVSGMLWRARKLLWTITLSAKKYGGLSLKKGGGM